HRRLLRIDVVPTGHIAAFKARVVFGRVEHIGVQWLIAEGPLLHARLAFHDRPFAAGLRRHRRDHRRPQLQALVEAIRLTRSVAVRDVDRSSRGSRNHMSLIGALDEKARRNAGLRTNRRTPRPTGAADTTTASTRALDAAEHVTGLLVEHRGVESISV